MNRAFVLVAISLLLSPAGRAANLETSGDGSAGPTPVSLWNQMVLIGASATAGMKDPSSALQPNSTGCGIEPYLEAALQVPHAPIANLANRFFFLSPRAIGTAQINAALQKNPSLVIGIDFLFWYLYGDMPSEKDRMNRWKKGLAELDRLQAPLILGDIPDASGAANYMLAANQIPEPETLAAANASLRKWASTRRNVILLNVANFMRAARENQPLSIHSEEVQTTSRLLQVDHLHPAARGAAALALAILDALTVAHPNAGAQQILWDLDLLVQRGGTERPQEITASTRAASEPAPPSQAK